MRDETETVPGNLSWYANEIGSVLYFRFVGVLDVAVAQETATALWGHLTGSGRTVMFDLSEVSFMDSTGLQLLVKAKNRLEAGQGRLLIARPSAAVERLLVVAGLEAWFDRLDGNLPALISCPVCNGDVSPLARRCGLCGSAL